MQSQLMFISDLQQVGSFLLVLQFPPQNCLPQYNWIVESGVKHNNPYPEAFHVASFFFQDRLKIPLKKTEITHFWSSS